MLPTRDSELSAEARTSAPCEAHGRHFPAPLYTERHHVVPQAWQAFWTPSVVPVKVDAELVRSTATNISVVLWDPRTVNLCRTGHGNVHWILVRLMRAFSTGPLHQPVEPTKFKHWADLLGKMAFPDKSVKIPRVELGIAKLGIVRWIEAGGSLEALTKQGLFGEI